MFRFRLTMGVICYEFICEIMKGNSFDNDMKEVNLFSPVTFPVNIRFNTTQFGEINFQENSYLMKML